MRWRRPWECWVRRKRAIRGSNRGLVLTSRLLFTNDLGPSQPRRFDKKQPSPPGVFLRQKREVSDHLKLFPESG
jgi:hypothetical protein